MEAGQLIAALAYHATSDAEEEAALLKILKFLSLSAEPFSRANPEGHITGSAVIGRIDGSAFLLIRHRKLERWLQPGGHTDPEDENVLATALREAREETGVVALSPAANGRVIDVDVHPIPARRAEPAHLHFDLRYLATTEETALAPQAVETRGARWFTLEEAIAEGVEESLLRALRKAHALLAKPGRSLPGR